MPVEGSEAPKGANFELISQDSRGIGEEKKDVFCKFVKLPLNKIFILIMQRKLIKR